MRNWYLGLEDRERVMVAVGAALVLIFILWAAVLSPLHGASAAAASRVETKRNTLAFLRGAAAELAAAADMPAAAADLAGQSLVVIVDRSAREAGLGAALTRNQPVGEDGIRVRLEGAAFDATTRWLAMLNTSAGLAIESANFDRTPEEGRVNASLVLRQGLQ